MVNRMSEKVALFEEKEIRKVWNDGEWYFSVIDVIELLTGSVKPRDYWYRLKVRESQETKMELSTICRQLKLLSADGKKYKTDCANTKGILRIIQSIPSSKAEPFKQWLAQLGHERIEEINDPELAVARAKAIYDKKGYSEPWINYRMKGIDSRLQLTEEWKNRGVQNASEYAILTNEIYQSEFDMTAKQLRELKHISDKVNLRDSFDEIELVLTDLTEVTAKRIHQTKDTMGFQDLKNDVRVAGTISKEARVKIEGAVGTNIVTSQNHNDLIRK